MNNWQRWIKAPHTLKLRRFLFQVHLWMGIGFGLYILMISVSGSAIVLRPQFSGWFIQTQVDATSEQPLTGSTLENRVAEVYQGYEVMRIAPPNREGRATYVVLEKNGEEFTNYFDHFTGKDLGSTYPWPVRTVEWLTKLHDELLLDRNTGRFFNGLGGILLLTMVITGLVIWWQGRQRWKAGLLISKTSPHSFMWQLHSFLGFWSLLLMLVWGVTAVYFAFPQPFDFIIDAMDKDLEDFDRPDGWLRLLLDFHFGRFRNSWPVLPYLWILLGLLPAIMYISGFVLWYQRVLKKYL